MSETAEEENEINYCFLLQLICLNSLGVFQFGFSISAWAILHDCFVVLQPDVVAGDRMDVKTLITSVTVVGQVLGALSSGQLENFGRWNSLMLYSVMALIGTIGSFFYMNLPILCVSRIIVGTSAGAFSLLCPKYINECSPKEVSGPAGASFQLALTIGILVNSLVRVFFPDSLAGDPETSLRLYHILMSIPLVSACI